VTYTGDVHVGGPADVRELPGLVLSKIAVGPYDNNAYLLRCRATGEQILIDAAADADVLLDLIGADGIEAVITTHSHGDHWQALGAVVAATGATTMAGRYDADDIPVATDVVIDDGDVIVCGALSLKAIHLVGHTPGSIALLYDDPEGQPHLFTGDSLFPGGIGKTTTPENFASLHHDVSVKIFDALPDETWVYPGHGHDTLLGTESPHREEWARRGW